MHLRRGRETSSLGDDRRARHAARSRRDRPADRLRRDAPLAAIASTRSPRSSRRWPPPSSSSVPVTAPAGDVDHPQRAVGDGEDPAAVGLEDVRLVDAELLHVGAGEVRDRAARRARRLRRTPARRVGDVRAALSTRRRGSAASSTASTGGGAARPVDADAAVACAARRRARSRRAACRRRRPSGAAASPLRRRPPRPRGSAGDRRERFAYGQRTQQCRVGKSRPILAHASRAAMSPCVCVAAAARRARGGTARRALSLCPITLLDADPVAAAQPAREPQRRRQLALVAQHLAVAEADVLDPDRRVVQPDRVPAHDRARDELVDRAVAVDHVVRARARAARLQLGVRAVRARTC